MRTSESGKQAWSAWAVLPPRLVVGFGFMAHGYAKLSAGPDGFGRILGTLGIPAPELMAWLTTLGELFGGLAVLMGAFVTLASIPLAIIMLVAMFTIHLPYGFSSIKLMGFTENGPQFGTPGYELNLLYLAALLALMVAGAGPYSVDDWRRRSPGRP